MKARIRHTLAALLAAGAIPSAFAQAAQPTPVPPPEPTFTAEPAASTSTTAGVDGPIADAIARELNADPSMKGAKITVQPVEDGIVLTGATSTYAQVVRASEVARAHAGEGQVANVIQTDEIVLDAPQPPVAVEVQPEALTTDTPIEAEGDSVPPGYPEPATPSASQT